ncbi:MAG: hypothetical protein EHM13_03770, partial [Acidobacteria bacterium]
IGSALALFTLEHLLDGYASDPVIRQRLDSHVIYIVPRANPDGAEQMFAPVQSGRRTNSSPFDADNDGRVDEDGPDDLNKDGLITLMRVKDPKGPYAVSPDDGRLMRKADPSRGEVGGYALYWEGVDDDHDGFYNEDAAGGVDINRNFMHQYPYFQPDAGPHMVSEAETRALLDFVLAHRNIAAILTFGESDNLISPPGRRGEAGSPPALVDLFDFADRSNTEARKVGIFEEPAAGFARGFGGGRPPGGMMPGQRASQQPAGRAAAPARQPATSVNVSDAEYFRAISDRYRELTGLRTAGVVRGPTGAFHEYGYYQFGVPSFSTPGWGLPGTGRAAAGATDSGRPAVPPGASTGRGRPGTPGAPEADVAPAQGVDLRLLQWMDAEKVDGFVPWTPFTHPTLGDVEIGGFKPYAATNPPAAQVKALGEAHVKFILHLSSLFAKVRFAKAEATALGAGLYRVKAEVENTGYFPTALAHAVTARAVLPTKVQLDVPPDTIVTGNDKTNYVATLTGSGGRQAFE